MKSAILNVPYFFLHHHDLRVFFLSFERDGRVGWWRQNAVVIRFMLLCLFLLPRNVLFEWQSPNENSIEEKYILLTTYLCTYKRMLTISKKSRGNYFHVIDSKGGNQYSYMHFRAISSNFTSAFLCTNNWDNRQFQFQPMKLNFPFELNAFQMSVTDSSLLTTHTKQFYRVHELLLSLNVWSCTSCVTSFQYKDLLMACAAGDFQNDLERNLSCSSLLSK